MTTINAYLDFHGKCREAMNFYKDCFGAQLNLMPVAGSPMESKLPPEMKDKIMHSRLEKGSLLLMGTDLTGPQGYSTGNNITLNINCASEEEINEFYIRLSEDGKSIQPLGTTHWGAIHGLLLDKFGITWMLNFDKQRQ